MRWVVKVGSTVLTDSNGGLAKGRLTAIARQVNTLVGDGEEVLVVSSGAVASGFRHLGLSRPPRALSMRQAAASVGQFFLVGAYEEVFQAAGHVAGLVLLTHDDFNDRHRYLNARNTLQMLLRRGAIPLINENDAVAVDEIILGDNDQLAAMVAVMAEADRLVMLTAVDGVYDRDPEAAGAVTWATVEDPAATAATLSEGRSQFGRGGMRSKLRAAEKAGSFGIETYICSGFDETVLTRLQRGAHVGTRVPPGGKLSAKRFWLRFVTRPRGTVVVDDGAAKALIRQGRSLLAKGVVDVEGKFEAGDPVRIVLRGGQVVGRGLSGYADGELRWIAGAHTENIVSILGYRRDDEVVHRDNLVLEQAHRTRQHGHRTLET